MVKLFDTQTNVLKKPLTVDLAKFDELTLSSLCEQYATLGDIISVAIIAKEIAERYTKTPGRIYS